MVNPMNAVTENPWIADEAAAQAVLEQCGYHVKTAVVALIKQTSVEQAQALLEAAHGSVREAIA